MPELAFCAQSPTGGAADRVDTTGAPAAGRPRALVTHLRPDGDRITVKVRGEIDLDTSEQFRTDLRHALNRSVRGIDLDLEGVTFCDCSALNILLTLRHRALEQAKTVAVQSTSTAVDRLLTLTATRSLFTRPPGLTTAADPAQDTDMTDEPDQDLRIEVAQLRRAMQTRPTIDLARGILMASFNLTSEEAWTVLVAASQNTNTKLHSLAGDLVHAIKGDALPEAIQEQLSSAVARVNSSSGVTGGGAEDEDPDAAQAAN
ncbi:ANTAR domain-containing protein [Streptomyces sp. NPDC051243]|uniref:ANTAR domain-containing protein n=1 Tax=Streptomyces sp. NPDC051243 TaxID=3365646 RepID=UPI0037BBBC39